MKFIKSPNLPETTVNTVIIGEEYVNVLKPELEKRNIAVIPCPKNPFVDKRISSHADLSVVHIGFNEILISSSVATDRFIQNLSDIGLKITVSNSKIFQKYPYDAQLCATILGNKLIHNTKITDKKLLDVFNNNTIHINQGYSKCAICPVASKAIITTDRGVAKSLDSLGYDVLFINPEGIKLEGFPVGFIGGSTFKLSHDTLAFTGEICNLNDKTKIFNFLGKYKITPLFLTPLNIFDVGSIIPIIED